MKLTKNAVNYMMVYKKREKWVKYLMQHLHREKPTPSKIEIIKWSETTDFEIE
jgi:hypothetical protein